MAKQYMGWDGQKNDKGRTLLQHLGTYIVRAKDENFWVDTVVRLIRIFEDMYDYVLIPDCRFPSEIQTMRSQFPTVSVKIVRLNFVSSLTPEQLEHPSETALDHYAFDKHIKCESGIENIQREVESFVEHLLSTEEDPLIELSNVGYGDRNTF